MQTLTIPKVVNKETADWAYDILVNNRNASVKDVMKAMEIAEKVLSVYKRECEKQEEE